MDAAGAQFLLATSLTYESAETPEAIALVKKSEQMAEQYLKTNPVTQMEEPSRVFSRGELMELHRKAGEVLGELKKLPKIPEEKIRKELDAFNEEFLMGR